MKIKNADFSQLQPHQIDDVLKKLTTVDLIQYSTISDTCLNNVRNMRPKRNLNFKIKSYSSWFMLTLADGEDPTNYDKRHVIVVIHSMTMYQKYRRDGKKINFNGHLVRTACRKTEPKTIRTFWRSPIDGFVFMMDYLSLIFDSPPIYKIEMGSETQEERNQVCEWIKTNRNSEVELLRVSKGSELENNQLKHLLDNVQATISLTLYGKVNHNFSYIFPRCLPHFECDSSEWITPEQLSLLNHETFEVDVNLSNEALSGFVEKCIDGALPELKYCRIRNKNPEMNVNKVIEGVKHQKTRSQVKQMRDPLVPRKINVNGLYDYQCADEKVLTVCEADNLLPNNYLRFYIWSKNETYDESEEESDSDVEDEDED